MVISKYSTIALSYTELEFGQKLRDAMDMVDLYVTYDAPRKGTAKIGNRVRANKVVTSTSPYVYAVILNQRVKAMCVTL